MTKTNARSGRSASSVLFIVSLLHLLSVCLAHFEVVLMLLDLAAVDTTDKNKHRRSDEDEGGE